ncbi:SGNH hydrolase domain-containing protein [Thalassotalea fusca]
MGNTENVVGAVFGDSHAASFLQSFDNALSNKGQGFKNYVKFGCPPFRGLYRHDIVSYRDSCDTHYQKAYEEVIADNSLKTVLFIARFTLYLESTRFDNGEGGVEMGVTNEVIYDDVQFKNEIRPLIRRRELIADRMKFDINTLLNAGKKVILVYPVPEVGWDAPIIGIQKAWQNKKENIEVSTSLAKFIDRNSFTISVLDSFDESKQLDRIYPHKILCNTFVEDRCSVIHESTSFYADTNHLSNAGAKIVMTEIIKSI